MKYVVIVFALLIFSCANPKSESNNNDADTTQPAEASSPRNTLSGPDTTGIDQLDADTVSTDTN